MAGESAQLRYDVEVELERGASAPSLEVIRDLLGDVALGGREGPDHTMVLYLRVPADTLQQAITIGFGLVGQFGKPMAIWAIPTVPLRSRPPAVPDFISASEAATAAGRSRQAIHQQIATGSIKAGKVGREYTIRRALIAGDTPASTPQG
ncbi:hypothetical protein ACFV9C_44610 [Kribbella sp. NPDC059898]|uniref:hypothetical protein n=1 Tax=Kribbella sp. NPDC059898 TaxID=3346995 RepID=UPI0036497B53